MSSPRVLRCLAAAATILAAAPCAHADPFVYVAQTQRGAVAVIDAAVNALTTTLSVGAYPSALAVNRSGTRLYVANAGSDSISVVDLASRSTVATIRVGSMPVGLALDPVDSRLFVVNRISRSLSVIDATSGAVLKTIALGLPEYDRPVSVAVDPSGTKVHVLFDLSGTIQTLDATSGSVESTLQNRQDLLPLRLVAEPTGRRLYVVNWATRSGFDPPPGTTLVTVVDASGAAPVASIDAGDQVEGVSLAPQQGRTYVATYSGVKVVDTSSFAIVDAIPLPRGRMAIGETPVADRLYLSRYDDDSVIVVDPAARSVVATIPVPGGPGVVAAVPGPPANYQGLWWVPDGAESGWGVGLAHQGDTVFGVWFAYAASGRAHWSPFIARKSAAATYSGSLYWTVGPRFDSVPFDPGRVTAGAWGTASVDFVDGNDGTFDVVIPCPFDCPTFRMTKPITRQRFGALPTCVYGGQADLATATNYTDLWWAAPAGAESGWGMFLAQQGDTIFAAWFTYDLDGQPLWLVATADKVGPGRYAGTLHRTAGPPGFAGSFDRDKVVATPVGSMTLAFADGNRATFSYTVDIGGGSVTQSKSITREVFAAPGTVCR